MRRKGNTQYPYPGMGAYARDSTNTHTGQSCRARLGLVAPESGQAGLCKTPCWWCKIGVNPSNPCHLCSIYPFITKLQT